MSPVVITQSDSLPTADNLFPCCPAGAVDMVGSAASFWMADGVAGLGWEAQEATANPRPRAMKAMAPGLCAIDLLLKQASVRQTASTDLCLIEYHASQDTLLGGTLVPASGNRLMNGREMRREAGRAAAQLFKRYLEFSLASIAYTLDAKYNNNSAIF